jgi:hypothetical protein
MIAALLGEFWPYIAGAVGFIALLATTWLGGRKSARTDDKIKRLKEKDATNDAITNAPKSDTPADARAWLDAHAERLRDGRKP